MAYTVLARRYRSDTFDDVVGQDHVAQTLKKAIETNRVAHSFLFTGTRGVGKTSMARILAKALNCQSFDAPTTTPCGKCTNCLAIAKGEGYDVLEIDAASNTGVDTIRNEIIRLAPERPSNLSRYRVFIIDEVHMLSKGAFNALLKIMEEPPEHVKFILATTEVDKILPTILSRCQRYDFRNIPTREIVEHLRRICVEEGVKAEDDALALVARAGAGSMRDALSLLDRLLSVGEKALTAGMIESLLGMPRAAAIFGIAEAIGQGNVRATLETANGVIDNGLSADTLIASLVDHFHNLLVLATCGTKSGLVDLVGIDAAELETQARAFDPTALTTNIAILEELRRQMRSSQAGRALLDATLARLALAGEFSTLGEMMARLNGTPAPPRSAPQKVVATSASSPRSLPSAEKKTPEISVERGAGSGKESVQTTALADAPLPAPQSTLPTPDDPSDELPAVGKVASEGATRSLWQAFKKSGVKPTPASPTTHDDSPPEPAHLANLRAQATEKLAGRHAAMFDQARLTAYDDGTGVLTFAFAADAAGQAAYVRKHRDAFAAAFAEVTGRPVAIELDVAPEPAVAAVAPADASPRAVRPRLDDVEADEKNVPATPSLDVDAVKDDPLVAAILRTFDGSRIVKVE